MNCPICNHILFPSLEYKEMIKVCHGIDHDCKYYNDKSYIIILPKVDLIGSFNLKDKSIIDCEIFRKNLSLIYIY